MRPFQKVLMIILVDMLLILGLLTGMNRNLFQQYLLPQSLVPVPAQAERNLSGSALSLTASDLAFLDEVARDTWTYLHSDWATDNHLPWSWRSATLSGGDYANPTEIGLYALSWVGAYEMKAAWSPTWPEVEVEVMAVLDQLEAWQSDGQSNTYTGSVFYRGYWINSNPPGVGVGNYNHEVPSIDNAFLASSLLTIREYAEVNGHTALSQKANNVLKDMNFLLWYDSNRHQFNWGSPNDPKGGTWADYYSNENRLINFMARALGQLSPDEFELSLAALTQTPPATYDRGTPDLADDITIQKVAWDGSYFTYTAPALFIQEMDTIYAINTIIPATQAQIAYASDKGYTAWGLSDCFDTGTKVYTQQGSLPVAMTGAPEVQPGLVTPHASALALITPLSHTATTNLQVLSTTIPLLYDPSYGFKDSVMANPAVAEYSSVSARFSALAQEWIFLAIVNARTGFIWHYFYQDSGVLNAHAEMFDWGRTYLPIVLKQS